MQEGEANILVGIITGSLFVVLFGCIMLLVIINMFKIKKRLLLEKQVREAQFREELLQAQLEMQEHTFKEVSREIHDNVGQVLSLAKVKLNLLSMDDKTDTQLHGIKALVTQAIGDLRNLSDGYYADRLAEEGLLTAIRHALAQLETLQLFRIDFVCHVQECRLDTSRTIFLYRMVQEILNNIVKHAAATEVRILVERYEATICIRIQDNGKGFTVNAPGFKPGMGLGSLQHRAAIIEAQLHIESVAGEGTLVVLQFKENGHD